ERLTGPGGALTVPAGPGPTADAEGLDPAPPAPLPAGTLFVVATPIGNLEDITLRALRVLRAVDLVAAEDTRRTPSLLQAYGARAPLISYFEHNQARRGPELLRRLQAGARVALVTDAGTPGVSDPGFRLVRLCRDAGVPVVPIPGASALVAALSAAGIPADRFVFEGFPPATPGRRLTRLRALAALGRPVVLYESPHRLLATLEAVETVFGEAEVVLAREVTKRFEEFRRGTASELRAALGAAGVRGEVTLVVNPREAPSSADPAEGCSSRRRSPPAATPRTSRRAACPSSPIWASCAPGSWCASSPSGSASPRPSAFRSRSSIGSPARSAPRSRRIRPTPAAACRPPRRSTRGWTPSSRERPTPPSSASF